MNVSGRLAKMKTECPAEGGMVEYTLVLDDEAVLPLNKHIGTEINLRFNGAIHCVHCGSSIKKTFGQGACWPCFTTLACNDMCIMKPETCHYAGGTCREPDWGLRNCMGEQSLYLARSAGIKIGITRGGNHLIRWADQGASEAMVIGTFTTRLEVGKAEKAISSGGIGDRTSWQKMLKNDITDAPFDDILRRVTELLTPAQQSHLIDQPKAINLSYPHSAWPLKVTSLKFDKVPHFTGVLRAIKGQYLIFDTKVINIRAQAGYGITLSF